MRLSRVFLSVAAVVILSSHLAAPWQTEGEKRDGEPKGATEWAAPEVPDAVGKESATPEFTNGEALEAFIDGVVEAHMRSEKLAGVTLSIVKGGEVVLLKGYGLAGVEPNHEVDPKRSLFRVGSISKTFIWTALMQLRERGLISLDDRVNDHLPEELAIPDDGFEEPIRIWHLMTHTPGFEDTALGHLFSRGREDLRRLHDYLARFRPRRVREPGTFTTYSNYGAGLAGYIVARISGVDFETYVEDKIYRPLGMTHSTFREPYGDDAPAGLPARMPAELETDVTQGIEWSEGAWEAQEYEFITPIGPAGAMSSTAADMARYMRALLQDGELEGERILGVESAREMQRTLFANAEGMSGLAHGFLQYAIPGRRANFGHAGGTLYFRSNMVMVPELELGIFVSTNSAAGGEFVMDILPNLLIGRYFGVGERAGEPPVDFVERGQKYAGSYLNTRRAYTLLEKIASMANVTAVSVTDDGHLLTSAGGETARWVEVKPHLFREVGGDRIIGFHEDESGHVTRMYNSYGLTAGERVGFLGGPQWFGIILALGIISGFGMTAGAWLRRGRRVEQTGLEKYSGRLMAVLGILWLSFFIAVGVAVAGAIAAENEIIYEFPTLSMVVALAIMMVTAPLTIAAVASLYPVWRGGRWPVWRRIRHTLAILILVALVVTLNHWNVIGFKYF